MKRLSLLAAVFLLFSMWGCAAPEEAPQVLATTRPVYDLTTELCAGTDLTVGLLIRENVSCLHDYTLSVNQVRSVELAQVLVTSGAGLEDFMADLLEGRGTVVDSSRGIPLLECSQAHHHHAEDHSHEQDGHIWLAPKNAREMAANISAGLSEIYPEKAAVFQKNLSRVQDRLDALQAYGEEALSGLSCKELVTFHDGFSYLADAFGLTIAAAMEEESGSEASAKELSELIQLIEHHQIPAIFTETNGSTSAAQIISRELGVKIYTLDLAMGEGNYFDSMYRNIDTIKEALE